MTLDCYIMSEPVDICREVRCWLALKRLHNKQWGPRAADGTVGIRVLLQHPQRAIKIVVATYVISFPTTEKLGAR